MSGDANYRTDLTPVWCPGCGGFAILNALTRQVFPNLGIPRHQALIISGIGCSSRIPGYVDTYGFNSLHGRAVTIAQGAKLAKPELTVLAIGGDGDFFSIRAGHLPHAVRRNINITCIMVNNFVYAPDQGPDQPHKSLSATGRRAFPLPAVLSSGGPGTRYGQLQRCHKGKFRSYPDPEIFNKLKKIDPPHSAKYDSAMP